jgi:hypothetical protein
MTLVGLYEYFSFNETGDRGFVYMVSQAMAAEGLSGHLVFSSYIDAVRRTTWDLNPFPEDRRPIGSQFHQSQYQTNDPLRGHPSHAVDVEDWTSSGLNHLSIDDWHGVLDRLTLHFKYWIML